MTTINPGNLPQSNILLDKKPLFVTVTSDEGCAVVFSDCTGNPGESISGMGNICVRITEKWASMLGVVQHGKIVSGSSFEADYPGRVISCEAVTPVQFHCRVYGHLSGEMWQKYRHDGYVNQQQLPPKIKENELLSYPLFIPCDTETGEPVTFAQLIAELGKKGAEELRRSCVQLFEKARKKLDTAKIVLLETEMNFGLDEKGRLVVLGDLFTLRNSRFCKETDIINTQIPTDADLRNEETDPLTRFSAFLQEL